MRTILVLAVAATVAAGCVSSSTSNQSSSGAGMMDMSTAWAEKALSDHGLSGDQAKLTAAHRDWRQHLNLSTPNFLELAHDPLGIDAFENQTAGGYFCGGQATTDSGRRLTVISSYDTSVAFVVVDTTDPFHPKHLGDYILDNAQTYDVDITPDGKHVAVAADVGPNQTPPPGRDGANPAANPALVAAGKVPMITLHPKFRDACTGVERAAGPDQTYAAGPSTILVGLADPTTPQFEDLVPSPVIGPHSVSTAIIAGTTYIAASITNLVHQASYYQFFQVVEGPALPSPGPAGGKLVQLSVFDAGAAGSMATGNGHVDAEIEVNPATKKPVVYLSDWGGGLIILDFSVPQAPTVLGTWADSGPQGGNMHSTRSLDGLHNGHHYLLAGQEFTSHPSNRPSGWVYILDDTDPTHITEVGRWTLPVDSQPNWGGVELFSTHYFRAVNDTVFVAMYHGGLWAFRLDFDNLTNMKTPKTVGVFVPDGGPQNGRKPTGGYDYAPFVLDVFPYPDDMLVVYDGLTGVYSVHYDRAHDMPSPTPWPAEGKAAS